MSIFAFRRFELDTERQTLLVDGRSAGIRGRSVEVLAILVTNAGRVVCHDEIIATVWRGVVVGENNLPVQMSILRRCLKLYGADDLIETLPNRRGYRFSPLATVRLVEDVQAAAVTDLTVAQNGGRPMPIAMGPAKVAPARQSKMLGWQITGSLAALATLGVVTGGMWLRAGPERLAADVRVEAKPDTIIMEPDGYCRVDYVFRVNDNVDLQLATEDVRFHLISGEPVSEPSVRGRIYRGSFPIMGPGTGIYHNNIYLPEAVVAAARANGSQSVYLRHLFHLSNPYGGEVNVPAVLQIIFGTRAEACLVPK